METLHLNSNSKAELLTYREENHLMRHEAEILNEIIAAIENGNFSLVEWFTGFGNSVRAVLMNVRAYRKGLEFGFTEIAFDQYDWFKRPRFLNVENLKFGNIERYGEHSVLHIGSGVSSVWTYALDYSYGTAGGGSALSVYGKQFPSHTAALNAGLNELKLMMKAKIGDTDTTNFKQAVIQGTLKAITKFETDQVQLTLF